MIRYLKHDEIDRDRWDDCIERSVNGIIYASSWYLDVVSPGWEALAEEDYSVVFPLTHNRKFGIHYLYQPWFTQQLGVFTHGHLTPDRVREFLSSIPAKFRFAEINLNSLNKADPSIFEVKTRVNLELDLIDSYENLKKKYDQNARRNLKKAFEMSVTIRRKVEPDELITLFRDNYGKKEKNLKFMHYEMLRKLMIAGMKKRNAVITGAFLPDGRFCAGVFFLRDLSRIIFHFAASGQAARETGAMFMLVDSIVREFAGQNLVLDFEGSDDPNVARFYRSFGASECNYSQITINRLSWPGKIALNFRKRLRSL